MIERVDYLKVLPEAPVLFDQPLGNVKNPIVTILIPTLNEELTIGEFIGWANIGLDSANVAGEILIVDSSYDRTPSIAFELGARVLRIPRKGLGNAYKSAVPFIRGKYVILGDADCTYDFKVLNPFLTELQSGVSFVMGNRFSGEIEKNSMPLLHRYFGTPLTSWLLRKLHNLSFGDIHCGMRALSTTLYKNLPFDEPGWEYAPEMVIRASQLATKTSEVPIKFFKEPEGRISHFRRGRFAWVSPFRAGLGSIRVSLLHALDKILVRVGLFVFSLATLSLLGVVFLNLNVGSATLGNGTAAIFAMFGISGYFLVLLGYLFKRLFSRSTTPQSRFSRLLGFEFTTISLCLCTLLVITYSLVSISLCRNEFYCFQSEDSRVIRVNILCIYLEVISATTWIGSIIRSYLSYASTHQVKLNESSI